MRSNVRHSYNLLRCAMSEAIQIAVLTDADPVTGLGVAAPLPIQRSQLETGAVFLYDTPLSHRQSRPLPVHQEGRDLDPVV